MTDDGKWYPEDEDGNPIRGCVFGFLLVAALWTLVGLLYNAMIR